jgi:DNA-binding Lrp family transcriptional regulator
MPDPEVDTGKLLEYRAKGLSYEDIADLVDLSVSTVHTRLVRIEALIEAGKTGQAYAQRRTEILQGLQAGLLARTAECLTDESQRAKISPYQAVGMFGILYDKERLETGKSSSNVAILSGIINKSEKSGDSALRKLSVEPHKLKVINPTDE